MRTTQRVLPAAALAVLIAAGAGAAVWRAATPDGPTRADLITAVKSDPRTSDVPDAAAGCVADWYLTYASRDQIEGLVDHTAVAGPPLSDEAKSAILECLKSAT
ncbi:hypothetical protein AB0M36_17955 [Actinoplanes sp. NPDC051346]|uniref:hypothetical protein n=1 Tax=Actinoplanes sp. NPDC051346 TaxID=3155048 RepID=UPI00342C7F69